MDTDKIIQDLNRRFAAPLPEFYQRRIIFWYDEDKEFEDKLDEVVLENAKVIALTGNNAFSVKKLLSVDDSSTNYLVYSPCVYNRPDDNWLLDVELYSEEFRADLISIWMDEMGLISNPAMRKQVKNYRAYFNAKDRRLKVSTQNKVPETPAQFHDSETKTDAGIRDIPMTQMVYDAFRKQRERNLMLGLQSNVEIGGRSGFIFNTKHGRPIMPAGVNSFLKNIVNAYNKKESKLAEEEKREPELMPPISSHTLRHTGCTRLGENNVNPKVMQYVMGCWMSGGDPFSTDRSGAKNIQMHRLQ